MLTLQRPDSKVIALMGENKGVRDGDGIRPSIFAIPFKLGKRRVVLNTLTGQCIETDSLSWFENPEELTYDERNAEMKDMVSAEFLVASDSDEIKKYKGILSILRQVEKPKEGYVGYTIIPTTACNARCIYCYELGMEYETMGDEIVEQTVRYIYATRREGAKIHLHWFGGEPLLGEAIIDRICEAMREVGIEYTSDMISNGSLMTEEIVKKAKESWHLNSVQITLDGREDLYCERKRYVAFEGSPYKAVLEGIHALLNQEIRVSIRLNADEDNLNELMSLVDELEIEFEKDSMISAYCHGIFAEEENDRSSIDLYNNMEKLSYRLEEFSRKRRGQSEINDERSYYDRRSRIKRYYCMADSPEGGPVILPNGELNLCEHIGELPVVGTVFDERPVNREAFIERERFTDGKCSRCGLLPVCTDFSGCPTVHRDCYREMLMAERRKLMALENETRIPPVKMDIQGKIIRVTNPDPVFLETNRELLVQPYLKSEETIDCDEAKMRIS